MIKIEEKKKIKYPFTWIGHPPKPSSVSHFLVIEYSPDDKINDLLEEAINDLESSEEE